MELTRFEDLKQVLASLPGAPVEARLERAWRDGSLLTWLETRNFHFGQPDAAFLKKIRKLERRLEGDAELGVFALSQLLFPGRPLDWAPGISIDSPERIEEVLAVHPQRRRELLDALMRLVMTGRLLEWCRAQRWSDWEVLSNLLQRLPDRTVTGYETLPAYAVRWQLDSRAPFPTGETEAASPEAVAAWIDAGADHRRRGLKLLESGWLDLWLHTTGRLAQPGGLEGVRKATCPEQAKIEMLLRLLDPARALPRVWVEPAKIALGDLLPGTRTERTVVIKTDGRGYVWGACALEGEAVGMRVHPLAFEGTPASFTLTIDTTGVAPFTQSDATLNLTCYDGRGEHRLRVPIRSRVQVPLADKIERSLAVGAIVGVPMAFLRLFAGMSLTPFNPFNARLDWVSMDWVSRQFDQSFGVFLGLLLLGLALVGVLIGAGIYLMRACRS